MIRVLVALLPLMLLLFCGSPQAEEAAPAEKPQAKEKEVPNYLILEVNGEKIHYNDVQKVWDDLFPGNASAPPLASFGDVVRDNIVRGVVSERLMLKEAERISLGDKPHVQEKLEALRRQLLVQELLNERHKDLDEANVKKRYEELVGKMEGKEEVHASHVLVESEEEAEKLLEDIEKGADFAEVATEHSADRGTASKGGDLGFFTQDQMVPEFAEAAYALKAGEVSEPVQSPFGWHIIKLHERRKLPLPTLEEVRPQIEKQLHSEADQQYILDLLKDADITYYGPDGDKLDFPIEQATAKE